jgi:hypothetical protein
MKFKELCLKYLLALLRGFWRKRKCKAFYLWKTIKSKAKTRHSRIPKHISINLSPHHSKILKEASDSRIKRPRSVRPASVDSPVDIGERLFKKAEELELKKEKIRKSLEVDYSFTPKISLGTPKWLQSRTRTEIQKKNEEIAIVSGNNILQFTSYTPNLKGIIENKIFVQSNKEVPQRKGLRVVANKKDRPGVVPGFVEDVSKENFFND